MRESKMFSRKKEARIWAKRYKMPGWTCRVSLDFYQLHTGSESRVVIKWILKGFGEVTVHSSGKMFYCWTEDNAIGLVTGMAATPQLAVKRAAAALYKKKTKIDKAVSVYMNKYYHRVKS